MVSPHELLATVESALLGPSPPSPSQRIELTHAIRSSLPSLRNLLFYPGPKASDRAQVQSKEVRLPDSSPISLDDLDVQIALKLSDDLNLNEIECIRLLVSANREWVLLGREPLEIFRLAAGLWYSERRDLITSLYTLLRAVILDQGLEVDLVSEIQKYLEDLFDSGLRQQMIALIKELNREESSGFGGPNAERYVLDFRGSLVLRKAVVFRERLSLSHCLVLSVLIAQISPKDVKDVFIALKDCAAEVNASDSTVLHQITFSLMFTLLIAFISDAIHLVSDKTSAISHDASFRQEFHEFVMSVGSNPDVEGFVDVIRLAWVVHMISFHDRSARDAVSGSSSRDLSNIYSCLQLVCSNNVFQFLLNRVLQTAAYQNDDEDLVYMYNAYMHKLMMFFLSHSYTREKVKELKEKAMSALSSYTTSGSDEFRGDNTFNSEQAQMSCQPFVSILELVGEIYQKEPELLFGNEDLWVFISFAGEDHTNIHTLVAFLRVLKTLASTEEGASKVFELLQGKMFRFIGWSTLFECISIYEEKFKQSLQNSGNMLPEFQEGDAQALVAYLNVLQKVVENGNPVERKKWFPDIEPFFKLLSYENVPPYLKGALRNAIAAFIKVSPALKDTIWSYLEQYDLPVIVGPAGSGGQHMSSQIYDMRFELNEVEARSEKYPSTLSFLNLLNALIAEERDVSDRGRRFVGIFRFVYDHVFRPFPQRAYADPSEKWQLVIACLQHFHMALSKYSVMDEDFSSAVDLIHPSAVTQSTPLETQLPTIELLKDFMSGKVAFRNIMSIILLGVNTIISERTSQIFGPFLEKAVQLSLEIIILAFEKDMLLADLWRPLYQPLDVILSQDHNQIIALLEYVRYDFSPQIQLCSIKIMGILSSRIAGLVQLLLKMNAAKGLIEDFASCLESRFDESHVIENTKNDAGVFILQLLLDNISQPAPNITHLLLKFDVDSPVERTVLQPKFHYSCLKVILDNLDRLSKPEINALLHEFGFQLIYELCLDPLTSGPTMDLLSTKKHQFFIKHLESFITSALPKRSNNQALRISTLHQRAWLLKLVALELHLADMASSAHKETCLAILSLIFVQCNDENCSGLNATQSIDIYGGHLGNSAIANSKVLELLEVVQFRLPETAAKYPQYILNLKYDTVVEDILKKPVTSDVGGVYYYSERGDRLIDLDSFHDKLLEMFSLVSPQVGPHFGEAEKGEIRESVQQLLRWCWRYNKNLEEQAAQLHMLTGWSHLVEVSISRRMSFLVDRSQILFEVLDASLSASASQDCSLKMAVILSNVALTCMAKLRDERFLCPGGVDPDNVTCLDIVTVKQLSSGACHSILFKLMMTILRNESSEMLRRRQYALLLSYFQYCRSILDPDIPSSVLCFLLHEDQDGDDDLNLQKIDREQAELERANFTILRKEAQAILDIVTRDAMQGSEAGKAISYYVLDAFISIDQEKFFLNQLQSRGIIRSCLTDITSVPYKDGRCSLESLQRLYTLEAQLLLLLRISHHYNKHGAQILISMSALDHIGSCKAIGLQMKGILRRDGPNVSKDYAGDVDKQSLLVTPILRLVSSLTSLVDTSDFLEVKNKIVREVIDFVKCNQSTFYQILKEDFSGASEMALERVNLIVSILSKVWPYEESDDYGFVQKLFSMMNAFFQRDVGSNTFTQSTNSREDQKKLELIFFRLCFSLSSYLYFLVKKKQMRFQVLDGVDDLARQQPTLLILVHLLNSVTISLERAGEEKFLLLNKIQDINELSRQEVDEIITVCRRQDCISPHDNIRKRRYIAMVEMCHMAGNRDQLITLLLQLGERVFNILLIHLLDDNIDLGDVSFLCGKLHPTLERLEQLKEDKIGRQALKSFQRSVSTLKEISIRNLAS